MFPIDLNSHLLFSISLFLPFILGYMPAQSYHHPSPPPPDRRSPEEKEFDRTLKALEAEIERLTRLRDTHLAQKKCENDLRHATVNIDILQAKLKSTKKIIEELSKVNPFKNPRISGDFLIDN